MTGPGSDSASRDETGASIYARLTKRADFVRAAKGGRFHTRAFSLQGTARDQTGPPRIGLTATRKTGTAVERNRIRRRLREALRLGAALNARPGHDYVIVARRELLCQPFAVLQSDLARAFDRIRRPGERGMPTSSRRT